jgi:hypothetical protein
MSSQQLKNTGDGRTHNNTDNEQELQQLHQAVNQALSALDMMKEPNSSPLVCMNDAQNSQITGGRHKYTPMN